MTLKLTFAILGVSLVVIALVALPTAAVSVLEFNRLIAQEATNNLSAIVIDYYGAHGSLVGIDDALRKNQSGLSAQSELLSLFPSVVTDPNGMVIVGAEDYQVGQVISSQELESGTRIQAGGKVIAVALPRRITAVTGAHAHFIHTAGLALVQAAIGAIILAALLSILLARTIARPLQVLTLAARKMAKGNLQQTVKLESHDEAGELAEAFNQMSANLARADQARRQMTADIAHELRNPLTVIAGYLDAMCTGDLQPTPQRIEAMHDEVQHLNLLVDDLRTLSLAEAGALSLDRQPLSPRDLLERVATRYSQQAAQKDISLSVQSAQDSPEIQADEVRILQVLDNLVANAIRHTPPHGQVCLAAQSADKHVLFSVADTGEGVRAEDLGRVFERFYRGDGSRSANDGESGLGLAIAKAFVEAHGGRIWAESAPGQGAKFVFEMSCGNSS